MEKGIQHQPTGAEGAGDKQPLLFRIAIVLCATTVRLDSKYAVAIAGIGAEQSQIVNFACFRCATKPRSIHKRALVLPAGSPAANPGRAMPFSNSILQAERW